jgi:glutathione S-transferase
MDRMRVYGVEPSYFTGKLETYLRFKEIPFERHSLTGPEFEGLIPKETGTLQMPAVQLTDGRWLTDTTPIIAWLETQHPDPAVIPEDPLQAFFSRLLEDYADEWLWRPAMHYRWSYAASRQQTGRAIMVEAGRNQPLPMWIKRQMISLRQLRTFVWGDAVTRHNRAHVEAGYLNALEQLGSILASRPYLLGDRPTLADVAYMGPMFRHFGIDATPAQIMRERAPRVYEWVARMWNARASELEGELLEGVPEDWGPILDEIGATHLEQLAANAEAWSEGRKRFDMTVQGAPYRNVPSSRYRVWCLEELRRDYEALPSEAREAARERLERHGCWEPLFRVDARPSGHDPDREAPFARGLRVFAF